MKKVEDMTLREIEEPRRMNSEIETRIGCKEAVNITIESFGTFTDLLGKYVIVRSYAAGVFAGVLKAKDGKEVELSNARRIWYWSGAASLSQMANDGVKNPNDCKFTQAVPIQIVTEAIEILPCSDLARKIIEGVKIWQQ